MPGRPARVRPRAEASKAAAGPAPASYGARSRSSTTVEPSSVHQAVTSGLRSGDLSAGRHSSANAAAPTSSAAAR